MGAASPAAGAAAAVIRDVMAGPSFQAGLADIAAQQRSSLAQAEARARACLREMVAVQTPWVVRLLRRVMRPLHIHAWVRNVDTAGLARLRELNRSHALVFLPCHRSYADSFVLGAALRDNGLPPNFFLPGANVAFWPLGSLFRRAGGVIIRRSIRDDAIYKLALREYFAYLAANRTNLEWFIEGGRSRTGKLRPPRYGLLRYLVDAIATGRAQDALLVPVSISYDQLPELGTMAAEEQGAAKTPEGLGWLLGYFRQQRHKAGTAHIAFGAPLSLSAGLALSAPAEPGGAAQPDARLAVERMAFEVCDRINAATPLLPHGLVTLALLGVGGRSLTIDQVLRVVAPLREYVEQRRLPAIDLDGAGTPQGVTATLAVLERAGVVSAWRQGREPVFGIPPGQHNAAAFYRNSAIHWFVNRAIVELVVLHAAEQPGADIVDIGWQEALRLRDLLKFDFFFARKQWYGGQIRAELALLDPQWQQHRLTPADARALLAEAKFLVAHRVLRSFLESNWVVAERLVALGTSPFGKEAEFLTECLGVGRQYQLQGRIVDPEAVSREGFSSALQAAANRKLLAADGETVLAGRRAWLEELRATLARVAVIDAIEAQRMESLHAPH